MSKEEQQEELSSSLISKKRNFKARILDKNSNDENDNKNNAVLSYLEDKWGRLDLNTAIRRAGDEGRYQKLVYINAVLILFSASFTVYTISYIIPDPVPFC